MKKDVKTRETHKEDILRTVEESLDPSCIRKNDTLDTQHMLAFKNTKCDGKYLLFFINEPF